MLPVRPVLVLPFTQSEMASGLTLRHCPASTPLP
jgi:hypothetical protein